MIIFILFKLLIFFGILFFFGWQLVRFIFSEKRIEALIPLGAVAGFSVYLFLLNALSYLIDIKINFYFILALLAFLGCFFFFFNKKKEKPEWGIDKQWRRILLGTCLLLMIPVGIIGIRMIDMTSLSHLPPAATIAEGNFPVRDLLAPNFPLQNHYGYNLFSAAIYKITNLPVWFALDFQNSIYMGVIFLLGFLIIKDFFVQNNFRAYFASLIMILGGNLNFLYGLEGFLHLSAEAPFKFLNDMIFGKGSVRGGLVAPHSQGEWIFLGFALTMAVTYLYYRAIQDKENWFKISFLAGIIFSFLALSAEVFFGALAIVFFVYPLVFTILKKDWEKGKLCFKISFLILFLGLSIGALQGGILTQTIKQNIFGHTLPIDYRFSMAQDSTNAYFSIFRSFSFLLGWGWMIIFIVPVTVYFLRKYFQPGLFLILLILISFSLPLIVNTSVSVLQGEFARINYLTALFWNLVFGLFLGWSLLYFKRKWQEFFVIILILGVVFQGLFYFVLFSIFPNLERDQPLLGEPRPNPAEIEAVDWIKSHTAIKDYFLNFEACNNTRFVMLTGRFAPNFYFYGGACVTERSGGIVFYRGFITLTPEMAGYQKILKACDPEALKTLNYHYLYVNESWPEGLAEICLASNDLELKFEAEEGNKFVRIYEII